MKKGHLTNRYSWVLATVRDIRNAPCKGKYLPDEQTIGDFIMGALEQALHDKRDLSFLVKATLKKLRETGLNPITKRRARNQFLVCAQELFDRGDISLDTYKDIADIVKDDERRAKIKERKKEKEAVQREGIDGLLGVGVKSPLAVERERKKRERQNEGW